jgi:hypothetical protein
MDSHALPVRQAALSALNGDGRRNAMLVLGLLALQDETLDEALRWFGKLQAIDPKDPEPPFAIALVHLWAGSPGEAVGSLRGITNPDTLPRRVVYLKHLERTQQEMAGRDDPAVRCVLKYFRWYQQRAGTEGAQPPELTNCGSEGKSKPGGTKKQ